MPHFLTTLTATKANNATMMNVIKATKNAPIPNGPVVIVAKLSIPGIAKPIAGSSRSLTSD